MATEIEGKTTELETVNKVPLWLAAAITVALAVILSVQMGRWSVPLWVSFITWAEYFVLGANPAALKKIVICFPYGAVSVGLILTTSFLLGAIGFKPMGMWAFAISNFVWVSITIWSTKFHPILQEGSLALFNGLAMVFAVFFTGSANNLLAGYSGTNNPYLMIWLSVLWTVIAGYFGGILGWFNVLITFPYSRPK